MTHSLMVEPEVVIECLRIAIENIFTQVIVQSCRMEENECHFIGNCRCKRFFLIWIDEMDLTVDNNSTRETSSERHFSRNQKERSRKMCPDVFNVQITKTDGSTLYLLSSCHIQILRFFLLSIKQNYFCESFVRGWSITDYYL